MRAGGNTSLPEQHFSYITKITIEIGINFLRHYAYIVIANSHVSQK